MGEQFKSREWLLAELELAHKRITELELVTEKALQRYDDYFRIHFSLSNDVMYSYDSKYTLNYVSPNVERLLGYKPDELIGRRIPDLLFLMDPLDHEEVIEDALHALSGHTVFYSIYRFIAKDGTMIFGEVSGVPVIHDGRITGVVSVAREITEHAAGMKKQDAHRDQIRKLEKTSSPQVLLNASCIVLDLNEPAAEFMGKSIPELVGSSIFVHTPENLVTKRKKNFEKIMTSGRSDSFIEEFKGKLYYNTLSPVQDEQGHIAGFQFLIQELSGKRFSLNKIP
jgi:PAS domain S-box-containing protein